MSANHIIPQRLLVLLSLLGSFACATSLMNVSILDPAAARDRSAVTVLPHAVPAETEIDYRVYVTNEASGDLTVIDGRSRQVIATIALGKRPRGIAADARHRRLFVALSGSPFAGPGADESSLPPPDKREDGIAIINALTNKVERILRGLSDPEQVVLSADGERLYAASEDTGKGIAIDVGSGRIRGSLDVGGEPEGIAVNSRRNKIYFTSETQNIVTVADLKRFHAIGTTAVGQRPRDVAVAPDGSRVYVTGENDASLVILDSETGKLVTKQTVPGAGTRPKGVVVSNDGKRLYVSTGRGGEIVAYDAESIAVLGSVKVGARPWGLALSPDGKWLYVANGPSDDISIVATDPLRVDATLKAGKRPWGVAVMTVK